MSFSMLGKGSQVWYCFLSAEVVSNTCDLPKRGLGGVRRFYSND